MQNQKLLKKMQFKNLPENCWDGTEGWEERWWPYEKLSSVIYFLFFYLFNMQSIIYVYKLIAKLSSVI